MSDPKLATYLAILALAALSAAACGPKKSADVELEAARKAMADARSRHASDCAKETFSSAEAALAEAEALKTKGDIDGAKAKAAEAANLASRARAASPEGCDKPAPAEDTDPKLAAPKASNDSTAQLALGDILQTVYFDYNEANIREDSKAMLSKAAQLLSTDPNLKVEIEGHCDSRGSIEYNLQLGERRAHAVEKYLVTQGARPEQIQTISYGEERPIDLAENEAAYAKNRRAELHKR